MDKEKSKTWKDELKVTEKLKRELKGRAAVSLFQVLIQEYEKKKHEYKSRDEYRADIKDLSDTAWYYADVFMDSYGYKWPREQPFTVLCSGGAGPVARSS